MLVLLASVLFYALIMALVVKHRRQLKLQAVAVAKQRQQQLRQQRNRF
jgi:heme exporter protein D